MIHDLKCEMPYFELIRAGRKPFEVRRDDRAYAEGDTLRLREWDGCAYTGRSVDVDVTYILRCAERLGVAQGFAVLGIDLGAKPASGACPECSGLGFVETGVVEQGMRETDSCPACAGESTARASGPQGDPARAAALAVTNRLGAADCALDQETERRVKALLLVLEAAPATDAVEALARVMDKADADCVRAQSTADTLYVSVPWTEKTEFVRERRRAMARAALQSIGGTEAALRDGLDRIRLYRAEPADLTDEEVASLSEPCDDCQRDSFGACDKHYRMLHRRDAETGRRRRLEAFDMRRMAEEALQSTAPSTAAQAVQALVEVAGEAAALLDEIGEWVARDEGDFQRRVCTAGSVTEKADALRAAARPFGGDAQ